MGRKSTVLEQAANMLGPRYIEAYIHEGSEEGIVAFLDPHTLKREWTGPVFTGIVRFSGGELRKLKDDPEAKTKIYHRVEEAKQALLEQIQEVELKEGKALSKLALSLSLMLFAIIPASQFF